MSLLNSSAVRVSSRVYPAWLFEGLAKAENEAVTWPWAICEQRPRPLFCSGCFPSRTSTGDIVAANRPMKLVSGQWAAYYRRRNGGALQKARFSTTTTSPPEIHNSAPISDPRKPAWTPPVNASIRPVAIIGAGVLGRRLATLWASTGRPVNIYDTSPSALDSARLYIANSLANFCFTNQTHPGHVAFSTSLQSAVQNSWMVIEAVPDNLEVKISLLGRLDRLVGNDSIIATASSTYKSVELISEVKNRQRVLNTLYYVPPRNRCVEVMGNTYTSPLLFEFLIDQMRDIHLRPKIVRSESQGLILPRIWATVKREVLKELQEGVSEPADIDELFRDFFGARKGPCEKMDEIGLDTVALVERHFLERDGGRNGSVKHLKWLEEEFVKKGKLGDKSGEGLYLKHKQDGKHDTNAAEVWKEHAIDLSGV